MSTLESILHSLVEYATHAPSRNNTKPWKFEVKNDQIQVFIDYSKRLEATDPFNRELYISLGCAIANLEIAAEHFQIHYETYFFTGKDLENLAAIITFSLYKEPKQNYPVPLFHCIPLRHTNRNFFASTPVTNENLYEFTNAINWLKQIYLFTTDNKELKNYFADLSNQAEREQFNSPAFRHEQIKWLAGSDTSEGLPLSAFHLSPLSSFIFSINHEYNFGENKATYDTHTIKTSPGVAVVMTDKDEKLDWISAGIAFEVLALRATALGLAYQPMTAIIEVPHFRRKLQDITESTKIPQMFFRFGYPLKLNKLATQSSYARWHYS